MTLVPLYLFLKLHKDAAEPKMNEAAKSNADVADYNFSEEKYIDEFYQSANRNSWMALHAALKLKENSINPLLIKAGQRSQPCLLACIAYG